MKIVAFIELALILIPSLILMMLNMVQENHAIIALIFAIIVFVIILNHESIEITIKGFLTIKTVKEKIDKIAAQAIEELNNKIEILKKDLKKETRRTKSEIDQAKLIAYTSLNRHH